MNTADHNVLYKKYKTLTNLSIHAKLQCKWHMSSITLNTVAICCLCIPCLIASVCAQTTDYKQ